MRGPDILSLESHLQISTVITVYFDNGAGIELFRRAFASLEDQICAPFEVVISDDSKHVNLESEILNILAGSKLKARYLKNARKQGVAGNSNNGLIQLTGDIFHVLHLDDQLVDEKSYKTVIEYFGENNDAPWVFFAGFLGNSKYIPKSNNFIALGQNTFGGPSGLFVKSHVESLYDEELRMYVDTDLIARLQLDYPTGGFSDLGIVKYGAGPWQIQRNTTIEQLILELEHIVNKSYVTPTLIRASGLGIKGASHKRFISQALYNQGKISSRQYRIRLNLANFEEKLSAIKHHFKRIFK